MLAYDVSYQMIKFDKEYAL